MISNSKITHIIIIIMLVLTAYFNSLQNAFVSDDIPGILNNETINNPASIVAQPLFYLRPLIYFVITGLFGKAAIAFRIMNICFHLGAVLTAYFLICRLNGPRTAFFSAALFAIHPIQAESITWISGGPYSQYGFFLIAALLLYSLANKFYVFSIASFLFAAASNDKAVVFPLMLLTFMLSFENIKKCWKKSIPFFIIALIWVISCLLQVSDRLNTQRVAYSTDVKTLNPLIQIPIAVTSYFKLIFWPDSLTLYHSELSFSQSEYFIRLGLFLAFLAIIAYTFKRNRYVFFWLSFFIISLLPTLTPLGVSWIVAERYAYLGSLGIFAVIGLWLDKLKPKMPAFLIFFSIIIALSARTIIRNIDWKNEDNLWIATAKTSPSSPNTHNNLGDVYSRRGDFNNALKEFGKAIEINPRYADAYHNLASTYLNMGKLKEAKINYEKAIFFNPALWQSYQNLSVIYCQEGNFEKAKESAILAIKINPANEKLKTNLAIINGNLAQEQKDKPAKTIGSQRTLDAAKS